MEIIVKNLPESTTEKQVRNLFRPYLAKLSIDSYHCNKLKKGGFATLTIGDAGKAAKFLMLHGQDGPGWEHFSKVKTKIFHMRKPIYCSKSYQIPDPFLIQSLLREETKNLAKGYQKTSSVSGQAGGLQRKFGIISLACGQWDYSGKTLFFQTHFQDDRTGIMIFGNRFLIIDLKPAHHSQPGHRLEIPYNQFESFTIGPTSNAAVTFSLHAPPKLLESLELPNGENSLVAGLRNLSVRTRQPTFKWKRITALNKGHEVVASSCLCYRVTLQHPNEISWLKMLKRIPEIPESIPWNTHNIKAFSLSAQLTRLNQALGGKEHEKVPFGVKFQFQKLAQNGYLPPNTVADLFQKIYRNRTKVDETTMIASIRKLANEMPFAGPKTESLELSVQTLTEFLSQYQQSAAREDYYLNLAEKYDHIALIHKATVTPAGLFLSGPEPEIINRVIRKYLAFSSYFLQVTFEDESGETVRNNREVSNEEIFRKRFKGVLEGIINIAGRGYEFLGFSHSSLRAQACWFMAPFVMNGELLYAKSVIERLGDFSMIRSPAKCAARIGQAFSQTFSSITLPSEAIRHLPEIERNGRKFSDGVGTCSESVMKKIWKEYAQSRELKPTVFQIRFRGAKGMISLDSRLEGDSLCLRPSMIKFEGALEHNIEICGAGHRPLPMYLNRQLIKILEDLGVPERVFLDLQAVAVEKLRMTAESPVNAANFLQRNDIGKSSKLSWLIRKLVDLNVLFSDDDFLRNTLELAVLVQLRELKHRSRILVEDGFTLYGIMDETGLLEEGQVYCPVHSEDGGMIITGKVVITRSPALHPGDVQYVDAVEVPEDSPLRALHNCVVFSSKGERDLPSKLSGGDLDGDLYNIIFLPDLFPSFISEPADYPIVAPIDIGRKVTRSDMTDFFIRFMENDHLGRIAVSHQKLADQKERGTFDPECIKLASLHSTAVDFSKTGISVDMSSMPRISDVRPDFQAPGPRVLIEEDVTLIDDDSDKDDEKEESEEPSVRRIRYYRSHKVLGSLYRAIDEHKIFEQIRRYSRAPRVSLTAGQFPIDRVWKYVQEVTALIQWRHYETFAKEVKEAYEELLTSTMIDYATNPTYFISEVEVFCGNILGKDGAQSKRQRDVSITMKEKHERDVAHIVAYITQGVEDDNRLEALERSIACLAIACSTVRIRKKVGTLVSFGWVAAAVCLQEVERFQDKFQRI